MCAWMGWWVCVGHWVAGWVSLIMDYGIRWGKQGERGRREDEEEGEGEGEGEDGSSCHDIS